MKQNLFHIYLLLSILVFSCTNRKGQGKGLPSEIEGKIISAWEPDLYKNYPLLVYDNAGTEIIQWLGFDSQSFEYKGSLNQIKDSSWICYGEFKNGNTYVKIADSLSITIDTLVFTESQLFLFPIKFNLIYPNLTQQEANQYLHLA